MAQVKSFSKTAINIKAIFIMDYFTDKESSFGQMESFMKDNLQTIASLAKVFINGQMAVHTKEK
jgi:hypothetical protein